MKPKPFPKVQLDSTRVYDHTVCIDYGWFMEQYNDAACKHGRGECETCGTSGRRDVLHQTIGGRGKIARLMKRL